MIFCRLYLPIFLLSLCGCPGKNTSGPPVKVSAQARQNPEKECPLFGKSDLNTEVQLERPPRVAISLPMPSPLQDPNPVPTRTTLKMQRRRAARSTGESRWKANTQLAALLWSLAHQKIAQADNLSEKPRHIKKKIRLQRGAHAHLQECIALLEGVISEKKGYYLALLRLAYYLRNLKHDKATDRFQELLAHPGSKDVRGRLRLALGRIYLEQGALEPALRVLKEGGFSGKDVGVGNYLLATAHYRLGRPAKALSVLETAAEQESISQDLKEKIIGFLAVLWAVSSHPSSHYSDWVSISWVKPHARMVAQDTLRLLKEMGRGDIAVAFGKKASISIQGVTRDAKQEIGSPGDCLQRLGKRGRLCWLRCGAEAERFLPSNLSWKFRLHLYAGGEDVQDAHYERDESKKQEQGHCGLALRTPPPGPLPVSVSASLSRVSECLCKTLRSCLNSIPRPAKCTSRRISKVDIVLNKRKAIKEGDKRER